jgi:YegS/Rv2252/BmrU family lipid kinase
MADLERFIISNPTARRSRKQPAVDHLRDQLRRRRMAGEVVQAGDWAEASRLARQAAEQGYAQVVAAGGDGTVNAVANGLVGTDAVLGVLPFGTGNILAYNLGVATVPAALAALAADRRMKIDLGRIDDRYFVAVAGVGFDAKVARSIEDFWKQSLGRLAYLTEGIHQLYRDKPHLFHVDMEGEDCAAITEELWSAFFCNVPEHTWRLPLVREARPDDGWLHLILFRDADVWPFYLGLSDAVLWRSRDLAQLPGVSVHRVTKARVVTEPPWLWEADGDVGGETPVEVEVCPGALQVVTGETSP